MSIAGVSSSAFSVAAGQSLNQPPRPARAPNSTAPDQAKPATQTATARQPSPTHHHHGGNAHPTGTTHPPGALNTIA